MVSLSEVTDNKLELDLTSLHEATSIMSATLPWRAKDEKLMSTLDDVTQNAIRLSLWAAGDSQ